MKIKANGIAFNYDVSGPDHAPWLMFSNSLATNLSMWDEQAAALSDRFRVLRYDHRGHGLTDAPEGKYDFGSGRELFSFIPSQQAGLPPSLLLSDWAGWAPRFGFAYDLDGKNSTALRGGFGAAVAAVTLLDRRRARGLDPGRGRRRWYTRG